MLNVRLRTSAMYGKNWLRSSKDYKCIWGYDIMNEPNAMLKTTPWVKIAQACINAIREVDTETMLVISGDEFSSRAVGKR